MAGFFQQFLKGTVNGFLGSPNLKDYRHASKTFVASNYQNAPKFKWLFHVYFDINKYLIANNPELAFPSTSNYGLLVKSIDLPKFNLNLTEMNQYNRKRYIQTKINYDPIRITFHDDNASQLRKLWYAYYNYYYYDPSNPNMQNTASAQNNDPLYAATELNKKNVYQPVLPENQKNWGYNESSAGVSADEWTTDKTKFPFFKTIQIYGFNQHNFAMYQLINPMIDSFTHDNYSYSETTGTMENSMTIRYETVKYYEGALNGANPGVTVPQFADPGVYDTELSPINRVGTNRSIMGKGGLVDSVNGILGDLSSGNILGAVQTAGRVSRTFKNSQQILQAAKTELVAGAISAVTKPQTSRSQFNFPTLGSNSGVNGQNGNATNGVRTGPQPISVSDNSPISGSSGPG